MQLFEESEVTEKNFSLEKFFCKALDLFLPPLCINCYEPTVEHRVLCADCWKRINFISRPFCEICGASFEFSVGEGAVCGACLSSPPFFEKARSALIYDDFSKKLILDFKHGDKLQGTSLFVAWMLTAGKELIEDADFLIPVPLHRWRLFLRRYNQAALLAEKLGKKTGKKVIVDLLLRRKFTKSQGKMNRKHRHKNISGAFILNPRYQEETKHAKILLIDDVVTSGATVNECCRVLVNNGAAKVNVLSLMRTNSY